MLNLSEQWKEAYAEYLEEQESHFNEDINNISEELSSAQATITKSFQLMESYYTILTELKEDPEEGNAKVGSVFNFNLNPKDEDKQPETKDKHSDLRDMMKDLIGMTEKNHDIYEPAVTFTTQKVKDMGFFEGLVFFIGQIIKWIRNVVIYFIEKIKNLFRRMIGAKPHVLDPNALKLNLERVKKVESTFQSVDFGKGKDAVIKAYKVDSKNAPTLLEGFGDDVKKTFAEILGIDKGEEKTPIKERPVIVTVDLSRDMLNLRELVQHFYDLFDGAYGSNNEKLFEDDDLKVILNLFKDTVDNVKKGNLDVYSVDGRALEVSGVNKDRVKNNLILTNANIQKLKEAYTSTADKIKDITKIIQSKEMLMLKDMGVNFQLLTSSTYEQIKSILDSMPTRMKEAGKLEKDLSKMQTKYEKLVTELTAMQRTVESVTNVTYDSVYNRRMIDLLNAANWMSQTVSLRLAGLSLYIKEMQDVRDALVMLAGINLSAGAKKKLFK